MKQDKILERLLRKGTTTTSNIPATPRQAAVDQSIFEPKEIVRYNRKSALEAFITLPTRQLPPVITRTPSSPTAVIPVDYLLTEGGDFLMTESNDNLIQ